MDIMTKVRVLWEKVAELVTQENATVATLAGILPRIPADYSEDETRTGQKWIDGKDIYCRVFTGTFGVDNTPVVAGTISNYNKLVACFYNATNSFGNSTVNVATYCYVTSAGAVSCVPSAAAFYEQPFNAIVYYTKPDPVPAQVDKGTGMITGEDPEPETKKRKTKKEEK